jgi:hypothetical protein
MATIIIPFTYCIGGDPDKKVEIRFLDFLNHLKTTVEKLGKRFNLEVQKGDVDHSRITPENYKQ